MRIQGNESQCRTCVGGAVNVMHGNAGLSKTFEQEVAEHVLAEHADELAAPGPV
jgi:hypothetical protein